VLLAEDEHFVFDQCGGDLGDDRLVERVIEVDADDFGADPATDPPDVKF